MRERERERERVVSFLETYQEVPFFSFFISEAKLVASFFIRDGVLTL